ncbi:uncharacterized protein [Glycine max]|uniref:uncharacterized protein n=1 Tax=Glycine max TaxID=3847 RepID=UPI0003DE8BEE|nr:uncharacterized protein LOC102663542 [Glycine max]|eukprot:XP_006586526.1 uncharacterized protein LOC102663542 [Glycine max]
MVGRNERERLLTEALNNLAQVMANQGGGGGATMYHGLDCFQRNNPPTFKGSYDPEGAEAWLREIERIFQLTECQDHQKVLFATHMLADEVEYWWENTRPRLEGACGAIVPWGTFRQTFLEKYFPEDVKIGRRWSSLS